MAIEAAQLQVGNAFSGVLDPGREALGDLQQGFLSRLFTGHVTGSNGEIG